MKKLFAIGVLGTCLLSSAPFAAFPVVDYAAIAELISQINWLRRQYTTMTDTYRKVTDQYNQMVVNAKMITNKGRWKAWLTPWSFPSASNTYGTTNDWMAAAISGMNAANGYMRATVRLQDYGTVWGTLSTATQDRISRDYATLELNDGASVNSIAMLGGIRGNARGVENAIAQLENDSLSDAAELNTEVGLLNKINAASLIAIRNSQDTNKLLASVLEQDVIEGKARRDAQVQSINNEIAVRQRAPVFANQHLSGTTAILTGYRLP